MPGKPSKTKTLKIGLLTRVEGEGSLSVTTRNGQVETVELRIFEPPRFFEAFLRGRHLSEVPDIVARVCGICPVAYQMSAVHAIESIAGITVTGPLRALRRLLYCAEWIESHTLHIYMLHAPDFLGFASGLDMARRHPNLVKRGLKLKKAGNDLLTLLGGRSVHPVSVQVGGFSAVPDKPALVNQKDALRWARDAAVETVRWVAGFDFPDPEQPYTFVGLRSSTEYPMNEGVIVSNRGLSIPAEDFESCFIEEQVPYSTALHCTLHGESYLTGPLARLHLNADQLSPLAKQVMTQTGLVFPLSRISQGIVARALEVLLALEEALKIIDSYEPPAQAAISIDIPAGVGQAVTEAPRGILYHRYQIGSDGIIQEAKIVPPTSQNQRRIEDDLRSVLPQILRLPSPQAALACERIIRSYDPCISCATHFLRLHVTEAKRKDPQPLL